MGKIAIMMFCIMISACSKPHGYIVVKEDVNILNAEPYAIQQEYESNMVLMKSRSHSRLEILSTNYGKDFMYFKVRTSDKKVGYVIYSKRIDFYYYEE